MNEGGSLAVAVTIEGTSIASDLTLRIVKRNLTQVFGELTQGSTGTPQVPLPPDFPVLTPFDEDEPYIASSEYICTLSFTVKSVA